MSHARTADTEDLEDAAETDVDGRVVKPQANMEENNGHHGVEGDSTARASCHRSGSVHSACSCPRSLLRLIEPVCIFILAPSLFGVIPEIIL